VLAIAPTNATALATLAEAYDAASKPAEAAPVWVRFLETDTTSEELVERVVNALAREGNAKLAQPLIDRGTDLHPDNLPLLKLRWLVHLATSDWKGAEEAGEKLLERDAAVQADPEFRARLANTYRTDSQPARALAVAAAGVAKFPKDAPLYITYLQLLRVESEAALPRGLAAFPDNPELHVLAAQSMKSSGNSAGALAETRRALAANPRLPHGFLQLAQLEIDVGQIDSAYAAIEQASKYGESQTTVAQFALARGNALYKAATGTQKRDDYLRAMKFLALATRVGPTAESKFLLGASALSVSQSASTEAPATKSCELSKLADSSLTEAEINLVSGGSVAPDAAKQYLDYAAKLRPYVTDQVKSFCH
jgi:tetratricopeptide (TPR) repeat protein